VPVDLAPPVLLVHGFGTSADRTWRHNGWIDLLGDVGRTVIAPDLLGHGSAPKPHEPEAYADLERHVADQLPEAGPVDAVGFSLGARVLLVLAATHPDRFRRLVVAGVGANLFRDDDHAAVVQALQGHEPADANPVVSYFAGQARLPGNDAGALAALMARRPPPLTPDDLARITAPVLVVLGDQDFAGPADPLLAALPDASLVTLRGADHFATPKDLRFLDAALEFVGAAP
jgi:pimeloyl-ACP methyl ester carboxylesterase